MIEGLLGKKLGMTRVYDKAGNSIGVTVIEAGPCPVLQVKNKETDGYEALQLGFDRMKRKNVTKPLSGHFKQAASEPQRFIKEVKFHDEQRKSGDVITVDILEGAARVDVTGVSKGRGFAGVVKKYHMKGGPASHGSTRHRRVGSIGSSAFPSRVFKGQRMPGHMGQIKVTSENLSIIKIDKNKNLLLVKGTVPGANGSYILIRRSKY